VSQRFRGQQDPFLGDVFKNLVKTQVTKLSFLFLRADYLLFAVGLRFFWFV